MSSKWADTGILRKKQTKANFDDLLVFGYACKLFRDDERALYIDQGKHLIPWMGNDHLKIDRYDGRGALSDLSSCEASREGYDATRWLGFNDSERKLEQLCDEERYYSLHTNEEEEILYKEEDAKRQKANEFQYNYDAPNESEVTNQQLIATCEEEDREFVPSPLLNVPVDFEIPKTVKENARIEKTALFVSRQGPQMEILIKAKQSDNPQFSFMNKDDPLQKYYRFLLNAIKSGQYKPDEGPEENVDEATTTNTNENEHYLHPSLATTAMNVPTAPAMIAAAPVPVLQYKPAADCAYTQLVTLIKGNSIEKQEENNLNQQEQELTEQYYQYYQAQYYQYYHQIAQQYANQGNCDIKVILQNIQMQEQIQQQAIQYAQAACAQFSFTPKVIEEETKATIVPEVVPEAVPAVGSSKPEVKDQKISLVHYSSDSDEHETEDEPEPTTDVKSTFIIPPKDVAMIVDKMATYVSKNGTSFEQSVIEKGDYRFDFLHDTHKYHKYYQFKVNEFRNKIKTKPESLELTSINKPNINKDKKSIKTIIGGEKSKHKEPKAAVSFSIKKSKEEAITKEIKSALPVEESDEEGSTTLDSTTCNMSASVVTPESLQEENTSSSTPVMLPTETIGNASKTEERKVYCNDPIIEMIDLTEEVTRVEKNGYSKRLAEERVKDRLAAAVRLATAGRERALQADRKKRAALFLKMQSERKSDRDDKNRIKDKDKEVDRSRVSKADDSESSASESDLEEGEIKEKSRHKESSSRSRHKKSKHRRSYSDSKSRHRKLKKRKYSPQPSSSSSESD